MPKSSLEMRLEVREFYCKTWNEAMLEMQMLEEEGYFCSFMKSGAGFIVYYWF